MSLEPKRPGRPQLAAKREWREVHLAVTVELLEAVNAYCRSIGEVSVSYAVRRLLRDHLVELGYLTERSI